jgi:ubiquitin carboxyl-terminal hydrolase L5
VLNDYDEDLYFPKQVITNACATQAILSILLNNEDKIDLGSELNELKSFTKEMDATMKGLSISNSEKIRIEHNKFSK